MSGLSLLMLLITLMCSGSYTVAAVPAVKPIDIEIPEIRLKSMGMFELTAYCSCGACCGKWAENRIDGKVYGASGEELTQNYSIAVDTDVIPHGTIVIINGKEYKAQDCGGMIKGNKIDIYFSDHAEALEFGVQEAEIYIREER